MYNILVSMLGPSKSNLDETLQLQFSCPHCQEREGNQEKNKFHLEINLAKGIYNCWKCSSIDDSMHGTIYKLIRKYGNSSLLNDYKVAIDSFRKSELYSLNFAKYDFKTDYVDNIINGLTLPNGFNKLDENTDKENKAYIYLKNRGIDWNIITEYNIGYTNYDKNNKSQSNRIILPSFDINGEINYWTGRDFTNTPKRQRYFNPYVERKDIIFNELKVEWNADITLVEGPFDHIVVPNSIPLLGKSLTKDYKLYRDLYNKCNADINIWLDTDGLESAMKVYELLNNGRLKNKIKLIYLPQLDKDPSEIYKKNGYKGIINCLNQAVKLKEKKI